jgi:hypothetical protein
MKTKILFWLNPDNLSQKIFVHIKNKYPGSKMVDFRSKGDLALSLLDYKFLFNQKKNTTNKIMSKIYQDNIEEWLDNYYSRGMDKNISIFNLREIFKVQSQYIYNYLKDNNFSHLLISTDSGIGIDFLTYKIAKIIGLRTIFLFGEHRNFHFYSYDKNDWGDFKSSKKKLNKEKFIFDNIFKYKKPFYMNKRFLLTGNNLFKIIFRNPLLQIKNSISELFNIKLYKKWVKEKKREFISKKLPRNYVYFSLNHQPESTTIAFGNGYIDQILAIQDLKKMLPRNYKIVVKDHPAQENLYHRDDVFYHRLNSIDNLLISNSADNSQTLIQNSKCVALIYGATGWESLQKMKPVISFGQNWYNNLHGVFKYNKRLKFHDIENFNFQKDKFINSIEKLTVKTVPGVVYKSIQSEAVDFSNNFKKSNFVEDKEAKRTYDGILKLL